MFRFDPNKRYAMPAHFGPRPAGKGTAQYHDVTSIVVTYRTDRDKLAACLPDPFEVGKEPFVHVAYSMCKQVDWLAGHSYNLIGVNASAVFKGEVDHLAGAYSLVMWENLTDPILTGRELTGIPKIYADIPDHTIVAGEWRVVASHFGHTIMDMSVMNLKPFSPEQIEQRNKASQGANWMGLRYIPKIGGAGAELCQPTVFPTRGVVREAWAGEGKVEWRHLTWHQNPTQCHIVNALADLPILEYVSAMVSKGGSNLAPAGNPPRVLR